MRIIGDKNQISEDVFDFMISHLPFLQKSICSELAKLFSHQYIAVCLFFFKLIPYSGFLDKYRNSAFGALIAI